MVGGLAADFVAMAGRAVWSDDVLEVTFPFEATTAVAFLTRPETAAAINRVLSASAGRALRHRIVHEPKGRPSTTTDLAGRSPGDGPGPDPHGGGGGVVSPPSPRSKAALLRETMDHVLVAHARGLFDAAIRKVEPGRARPVAAAPPVPEATTDDSQALANGDEPD
jgi:hypothetical protein